MTQKMKKIPVGLVLSRIFMTSSRKIVEKALKVLGNPTHRGAVSADPKAGDGEILVQIPHQFFQGELSKKNVILPRPDDYAIGMFFLPRDQEEKNNTASM